MARAYLDRRTAEGKTRREAVRALKRLLSARSGGSGRNVPCPLIGFVEFLIAEAERPGDIALFISQAYPMELAQIDMRAVTPLGSNGGHSEAVGNRGTLIALVSDD